MSNIVMPTVEINTLNTSMQQTVSAMFWPAVALALIVPIAGAIGGAVGGVASRKITEESKKKGW